MSPIFPLFSILIVAILVQITIHNNFLGESPLCFAPKSVLHPATAILFFFSLILGKIFTQNRNVTKKSKVMNLQLSDFHSLSISVEPQKPPS